jgi:hypothetical protein
MTRRQYSNTATVATLTGAAAAADISMTLTSFADYPPPPFTATIARGEVDEEVVLVTAVSTSTVTVTRGYDGTTAKSHAAGATFVHTTIAKDFDEANAHVTAVTGVHGLASAPVGVSDTQSLTNKTLVAAVLSSPVITGTATLASATLSGAISVVGAATLSSASISGALGVTGNATISGNLSAAGAVTLGPITFAGSQVGTFASLNVSGASALHALTATTGAFTGATTVGGALTVTGTAAAATPVAAGDLTTKGYVDGKFTDTGWASLTGFNASYTVQGEGARTRVLNGVCYFQIVVSRTGSVSSGETLVSLPAGRRPAFTHWFTGSFAGAYVAREQLCPPARTAGLS